MLNIKRLVLFFFFAFFFYSSCSDINQPLTSSSIKTLNEENSTYDGVILDYERDRELCCNQFYPDHFTTSCEDNPDCIMFLDCGGEENIIFGFDCALLWARYVTSPIGIDLDQLGCDDNNDDSSPPPVTSFTGSNYRNKVHLSWSFIYGDEYVIQKKISTGTWSTVATIHRETTRWIDRNQTLPPSSTIRYRIFTKIYDALSISAPIVTFRPPRD
ncbi:MAG: hypothetical protein ISR83_05400 [Candidatus Marinimicrobia bacterium]|nr:hypothetical protein [Candidatus Neomarinimicrobiota bacterium]